MMRRTDQPARGDALARRYIGRWRRETARLQVLLNSAVDGSAIAAEALSLQRQCERLAAELQALGKRKFRSFETGNDLCTRGRPTA